MNQIRSSIGDPNDSVSFAFPDGVYTVSRGVLTSCGTSLSFASATFGEARFATVRLHSDHENANALASVVRFLSGVYVDLCPSRAPAVALASLRWGVPTLFLACFAVSEPLPLSQTSSLTAWLPTMAHWLPALDGHNTADNNGFLLSIPFRFRKLFIRRTAILMSHLISMTCGCAQCGLPPQTYPNSDCTPTTNTRGKTRRSQTRISPSCMLCARLQTGRSFWHALFSAGLLAEVMRDAVRLNSPAVTLYLYRVVIIILYRELHGVDETTCMLKSTQWHGAWAMAAKQYVNDVQGGSFGDARVSAIVTQTLLDARHEERGGGCFIGCVCTRIAKLSHCVEERCNEEEERGGKKNVSENFAMWDEWKLVITSKLVVKTEDGTTERTSLIAHVEVQRVGSSGEEQEEDGEDGWVCSSKCDRAVVLKMNWYVGGCACELECAKTDGDGGCMMKGKEVWSEWGRIREGGLDIEVMTTNELSQWVKTHSAECSLHMSARLDLVGVDAAESDTACSKADEDDDVDVDVDKGRGDGSECDSSGGDEEEEEERIACGCKKCIEEGCSAE